MFVLLCLVAAGIGLAIRPQNRGPAPAHAALHAARAPFHDVSELLTPPQSVATLAQLRANFATLRRAQRPSDRWNPQCDCAGSARQLNGLTRLARRGADGDRVYLDVEQFITGGQLNMAAGSVKMNLELVARNGDIDGSFFGPNVQYTVYPLSTGGLPRSTRAHSEIFASVIPDGVSSVAWTFGCADRLSIANHCDASHARTYRIPVIDNVAIRRVTVGGCPACQGATDVVWYSRAGRVLARYSQTGNLPAPPFVTGALGHGVDRILDGDSVGAARIGVPMSTAITALSRELGPPNDSYPAGSDCGIDRQTTWSSPALADPLTVYARAGRFVGFQYGAPLSEIGTERGPGAVLATEDGVTIGESVAKAEQRTGGRVATSARSQLGRWSMTTSGGKLYGYVLGEYHLHRVVGSDVLAEIDGGETGCAPTAP